MIVIEQATTEQQFNDVRKLMRAFIEWHSERHAEEKDLVDSYFDEGAFEEELVGLPGKFARPKGRILLASEDGNPAGCVAMHDLGDGACEMKRMFVYSEFHGRGLGRKLAEAIVNEAKQAGYAVMRLDTGARQVEAQGLYKKLGFKTIEAYAELPDKLRDWLVFMELDLKT